VGNVELPHTQSYIPDIGKGLVILGQRDEALGQAWHLPAPETVTTRQFIDMIFAAAGQEPKIQVAPKLLLRAMGLFNPSVREIIEMLYEFEEPFILDHSKFDQAFGNHATPLNEAIEATVAWFRQNPK
jgi:nucleoside-diphosphate-sugar epimerase